ncbi:hypothetical protein HPB52_022873 [Rhipicephalus sanguineus]|uniref:Uncharacterized protein n=1 Tax=Rhipicephalus sanguineus TaxID=34632 RepID=A0A9D4YR12_RHISA|nr:hypothetical protein HPB52_022873 [Rhipicephalus sanguineus]
MTAIAWEECVDIRAVAANHAGRLDELRHQLLLSRDALNHAATRPLPAAVPVGVTYASVASGAPPRTGPHEPVHPVTPNGALPVQHLMDITESQQRINQGKSMSTLCF